MNHTTSTLHRLALALLAATLTPLGLQAALPDAVPYQGRVAVDGTNFTGTGQFKFAVYEHDTGTFTPASATATISGGFLTIVTVNSSGTGYSANVTVGFTGGGGSGATATASVIGGSISAITVTNPGSGYTAAPTVVIADSAAPAQLWNNAAGATTAALAEPATAVALPVTNGLYTAGLGDTALTNMAALPASLAPAAGKRAFIRVWFNDGTHGFQAIAPDTELRSVPFAREALTAQNASSIGGVSLANIPRLDAANTFTAVNGLTVTGNGPSGNNAAAGATVPLTDAGTRLEFLPGYSAFRAGTVTSDQWAAHNMGLYSTAIGFNTTASGVSSTALGNFTKASGLYSTASGYNTTAGGDGSSAFGASTTASGDLSTALGMYTTASGTYSTALGAFTTAESGFETALGRYNTDYTPASTNGWSATDRLFVIGNGTDDNARHDALTLYKNAVLTVQGNGPDSSYATPAADATVPVAGKGTRMMFLPGYGAFRAGTVTGTQWNAASIGMYSTALGYNATASGYSSTAMGADTNASDAYSTAMGTSEASGMYSTAMGDSEASGYYSTAMGLSSKAIGYASTAMGDSEASGSYSTAMGYSEASGDASTAMGLFTTAQSFSETALGSWNTAAPSPHPTSWVLTDRLFVIGNGTAGDKRSDAFVILKNGNGTFPGVLTHGSDRNRKTDIAPADTAAVLAQLAALPIATWRFKDDPATHLGPMAQDFRATFQLGDTETGIASVDADGVALAAIQELTKQNAALKSEVSALQARLAALEAKLK